MPSKIELHSAPHRRIAVADILPNPHRNFELNPTNPVRIDRLLESYERTGFWDNIVVREHPTRENKYQLAYGHNRLAALKSRDVEVDMITIPVARLNDWEMYCAMVDENETQGNVTGAIAMENINVGCNLIEKALKKIGEKGTWEQFNRVIGRAVSVDTTQKDNSNQRFSQVRNAFFEGEGLGRSFLVGYLPCGKMRSNTISTVVNARYADDREAAKRAQAKLKEAEAKEKARKAKEEEDKEKRERLEAEAAAAKAEAIKLEALAEKIGRGNISKDVLLLFEAARTMTDFAEAIRKLGIDRKHHKTAAEYILKVQVKEERIERELLMWWDGVSGAAAARKNAARAQAEREALMKKLKGRDYISILLKLRDDYKAARENLKIAIAAVHLATPEERRVIEQIAVDANLIHTLVERSREMPGEFTEYPVQKLLVQR